MCPSNIRVLSIILHALITVVLFLSLLTHLGYYLLVCRSDGSAL
jgi:hypothetical protein